MLPRAREHWPRQLSFQQDTFPLFSSAPPALPISEERRKGGQATLVFFELFEFPSLLFNLEFPVDFYCKYRYFKPIFHGCDFSAAWLMVDLLPLLSSYCCSLLLLKKSKIGRVGRFLPRFHWLKSMIHIFGECYQLLLGQNSLANFDCAEVLAYYEYVWKKCRFHT